MKKTTRKNEEGKGKGIVTWEGTRARACPDMYTHREARTAAYPRARYVHATLPPLPCVHCATHPSPLLPPPRRSCPPSLPRLCIVRLTPPTPEPSRLPPLVSASSRLTLVWLDGPEGSGQFMPNYTLITVMARLRYRWCTELSNCHGPRERGLGSSIGRYDAARRGASMPI